MTQVTSSEQRSRAALFWRYWAAGTISNVGTAVTSVAMPLIAVSILHSSAFQVSLIVAASYAGWVVIGLPAGVIIERTPLRAVQVAMDLLRAVAVLSIPLAWWAGRLTATQLIVVALVVGLANVMFDVGNSTFLPLIVPREELTNRNSLISATDASTQLGGPSIGGLLVQLLGAVPTLIVDGVSYVVSAVLLQGLPRASTVHQRSSGRLVQQIREGWQFVTRHPVMRPSVAAAATVNFVAGGLLALAPVYLVRTLGAPAVVVGVLLAADGIGSLLGASVAPRLVRRLGSARAVIVAATAAALLVLVAPLGTGAGGMALFALGNAGFGAGVVVLSICTRTHRQVASPPHLLPRVMATVRFVSWGVLPLGALVAGALAEAFGPRVAIATVCAVTLLAPAALWMSRVRTLHDLTDEPQAAADEHTDERVAE